MFEPADVLESLNDSQQRPAMHGPGPLLVLAGAGTGKTRTLVARAAWLKAQGMTASRILLLTFTRRAADDMLARAAPRGAAEPPGPAASRPPAARPTTCSPGPRRGGQARTSGSAAGPSTRSPTRSS